jgi:hypothetical protein
VTEVKAARVEMEAKEVMATIVNGVVMGETEEQVETVPREKGEVKVAMEEVLLSR